MDRPGSRAYPRRLLTCTAMGVALLGACASSVQFRTTTADFAVAVGSTAASDWGLDAPRSIRFGVLSWVDGARPPRFAVHRLAPAVPRPSGRHVESLEARPDPNDQILVVADLRTGNRNRLGGFFNAFARAPSSARAAIARAPEMGRALQIEYDQREEGFCGAWLHLFDSAAAPDRRRYLDTRDFRYLSFWIRGSNGGERLLLRVADANLERSEEAAAVGEVASFLEAGRIARSWERVIVPLDRLPERVDRASLAVVVLEAAEPGEGRVWVRQLAFARDAAQLPTPEVAEQPSVTRADPVRLATWLWNTSELMRSDRRLAETVAFVERAGFDEVFLQLPGLPGETGRPDDAAWSDRRLREVVAAFRRRGIGVAALDGFRSYALPSMHPHVLDVVDRVVRYNESAGPDERFVGFHHDVEPYLLAGFHGPRREEILRGYLELIRESRRRALAAGLPYGMDIPFWYDAPDEYTHEPILVEFDGRVKPASHHVIDLVDEVTIMDYRTTAFGADGTIRHAEGELAYAAEVGRPVLIGLETTELPDETLLEFRGEALPALPDSLPRHGVVGAELLGDSIRMVIVRPIPGDGAAPQRSDVRERLEGLSLPVDDLLWWPIARSVSVPADKLTFWTLGAERLRQVAHATVEDLGRFPSFDGLAVHYVGSLQRLRACEPPEGCGPVEPADLRILPVPH